MSTKHLVVVGGPTASGKTSLAIQIAKHFNTEILSADSRQLYKELNIGVARPNDLELAEVKHHFIASHSIHSAVSAGEYAKQADALLNELFKLHDVVVMVGGTGLYIEAVINGLNELPKADENLRKQLNTLYQEQGIKALQEKLNHLDPNAKIKDADNPQRLIRAIEIVELSGKSLASATAKPVKKKDFTAHTFYLNPDRDMLYQRINERVDLMLSMGLVQEVRSLEKNRDLNALQTVGYSELFDHFNGKLTLEEAVEKIKQHSRNYAKRQFTWFKNKAYTALPSNSEEAVSMIAKELGID